MSPTVVNDLAVAMGMPLWFVGGTIGLGVLLLVVALTMRFLRARGIMLTAIITLTMFINVAMFAWPFWPVIIVGAMMLLQLTTIPSVSSLRVTLLRRSRLGTFRARKGGD